MLATRQRLRRLIWLWRELETGSSYGLTDWTIRLRISRRTLFRDIELLKEAGVFIRYDRTDQRYRLENGVTTLSGLTVEEVGSLLLGLKNLRERAIDPNTRVLESAEVKLLAGLPIELRQKYRALDQLVIFCREPCVDAACVQDVLHRVQKALTDKTSLHLNYENDDGEMIRDTAYPLALIHADGAWRLVAAVGRRGLSEVISLHRIKACTPGGVQGSLNGKSSQDLIGNAWKYRKDPIRNHVVIRFSKKVAGSVAEKSWHASQAFVFAFDGSLRFEVKVDGLDEITPWILSFGADAEVLEPRELRLRMSDQARLLFEQYRKPRCSTPKD